jgi:hypothetical protein
MRAIAPSTPAHVCPPARPQDAHAEVFAAGAGLSAPSLREFTCHSANKAVNIFFAPLKICRAEPPKAYAEKFAEGASVVKTVETCVAAVIEKVSHQNHAKLV